MNGELTTDESSSLDDGEIPILDELDAALFRATSAEAERDALKQTLADAEETIASLRERLVVLEARERQMAVLSDLIDAAKAYRAKVAVRTKERTPAAVRAAYAEEVEAGKRLDAEVAKALATDEESE